MNIKINKLPGALCGEHYITCINSSKEDVNIGIIAFNMFKKWEIQLYPRFHYSPNELREICDAVENFTP